jgi:ribokinase
VLLCLGSVNADFQMRVGQPPGSAETLLAQDLHRLAGGKAANRAFLAQRLGAEPVLLGRVGDDDLCEQALGPLRAAGLDLSGVGVAPGAMTAVSIIVVPPDGKKAIILAANANDAWNAQAIQQAAGRVASAPRGSVLAVDCEVAAEAVRAATAAARHAGIAVVLDPSWPDRVTDEVLGGALAVAPNVEEAHSLTGVLVQDDASAVEACRRLAARGVALPFLKLADGGCVFLEAGRATAVPAPKMDVVDRTGAGDAFTGALAVALLEQRSTRDAALFAVAAASLAVTGWGSQPAYPDRAAIEALIPQFAEKTHDL